MKFKINKQVKLSIFILLFSSVLSAQAFNLNDYFKKESNDELAQEKGTAPGQGIDKPRQYTGAQ